LEEYKAFCDEGAIGHADEDVRATMLMAVVWVAQLVGDQQLGQEYYQRLLDQYGGSPAADWARVYAPDRNIQVGKMIPDFSFTSLDDSTTTITRESLLGTTYLIGFWATYCGPCVAELPNLHEAAEVFGERGFEILSIAFDEDQDHIAEFRQRRWEMPWLHAHVPDASQDPAIWPFEVFGIPKAILVDAEGMIVGTDDEVRGERLVETLSRLLDGQLGAGN
jgi:thiol-disulfide isomerase/thioredoxin